MPDSFVRASKPKSNRVPRRHAVLVRSRTTLIIRESNSLFVFQVQQLSKKEIEDLLRKGAYGALMDEEDEGSKFCEEDIDQILQRRTHTITIESEGKGSTFAKVYSLLILTTSCHPASSYST